MGIKLTNYTLPEWVFLDANAHQGNQLEGRTVIQHIRSYTMIEVIAEEDILTGEFKGKKYNFEYKNFLGVVEKHFMIVHFSLTADHELDGIVNKAITWYCNYLKWEDQNILEDEQGDQN